MSDTNHLDLAVAELIRTTAKVRFSELQRHFAQGIVYVLAEGFDLIDVATKIIADDVQATATLIEEGALSRVEDDQARIWLEQSSVLWCTVVAPYVLVQPIIDGAAGMADGVGNE